MKVLRWFLLVLAIGVFCFSGYQLYGYWQENKASDQVNDTLIQSAVTQTAEPTEEVTEEGIHAPISVDFAALQSQYQDIVGWLYSPNTPINYPIMQSDDNAYYLRRLPDGSYNQNGSLFMDYRNAADFSDLNIIIYGHNMKNDNMFGTLTEYKTQAYYEEHPVLYLLTPEGDYGIRLIGGYVTESDSDAYHIPYELDGRNALLDAALQNSSFVSQVQVEDDQRLITLSTCSYDYDDARYILVGALYFLG